MALVAGGLPISIFILRGFFLRQPKELEDAAILDGCSAFDVYWRVMLPLARPGLAAVAVLEFLRVWNEYLLALVLFNSESLMPVQRGLTQVRVVGHARAADPAGRHGDGGAAGADPYAVAQRASSRGLMEGAVKG